MDKRVLKIKNAEFGAALDAYTGHIARVVYADMAQDDDIRGWTEGTAIRTSGVVQDTDGVNVGSLIETMNTIYVVVE